MERTAQNFDKHKQYICTVSEEADSAKSSAIVNIFANEQQFAKKGLFVCSKTKNIMEKFKLLNINPKLKLDWLCMFYESTYLVNINDNLPFSRDVITVVQIRL